MHIIAVVVEVSKTKTFVSALDRPGWYRSGCDDISALTALQAYVARTRQAVLHALDAATTHGLPARGPHRA